MNRAAQSTALTAAAKIFKRGERVFFMFCNSCNNSWLWIIIVLILLFAGNGNGWGCGCGDNNGCGCGCN